MQTPFIDQNCLLDKQVHAVHKKSLTYGIHDDRFTIDSAGWRDRHGPCLTEAAAERLFKSQNTQRRDIFPMDRLFTVLDLCRMLSVCRSTLYASIAKGQIPGVVRVGRQIRFSRAGITNWLSAEKKHVRGSNVSA